METRDAGVGNVVCFGGKAAALSFGAIAQVDAYWEALRAGRAMPDRAEVDPRGLNTALEFTFLLEHLAPGVGRVRISGMHLRDLLGMEVKGMPLTAFFKPEARAKIARVMDSVVQTPVVAEVALASAATLGRPALTARLYMAPLSYGDKLPRVLCCLESHGAIGRCPRRFEVERVQLRRIVETGAPASPAVPPSPVLSPRQVPERGFAEAPAQWDTSEQGRAAERPHLRLVHNDD